MAGKALIREDRPNVAIETDSFVGGRVPYW